MSDELLDTYWPGMVRLSDGNVCSLKEFRSICKSGSDVEVGAIFKAATGTISIGEATEKSRVVKTIITGPEKDRYGDTVNNEGWDFKNYEKNPVVLWAHSQRDAPIARSLELKQKRKLWESTDEFATAEQNPFAETIFQLVKGKFVNATSVGFLPTDFDFDDETWTFDFKKQELLEHSFVPVPAYPKALVTARNSGIDLNPLMEHTVRFMDECSSESGLYLPTEKVYAVLRGLGYGEAKSFFDMSVDDIQEAVTEKTSTGTEWNGNAITITHRPEDLPEEKELDIDWWFEVNVLDHSDIDLDVKEKGKIVDFLKIRGVGEDLFDNAISALEAFGYKDIANSVIENRRKQLVEEGVNLLKKSGAPISEIIRTLEGAEDSRPVLAIVEEPQMSIDADALREAISEQAEELRDMVTAVTGRVPLS
jgi:HK97 family phage prohead protease